MSDLLLRKSSDCVSLATATLGAHKARVNQLRTLNDIISSNVCWLNSASKQYFANDWQTLKLRIREFLDAIDKMESEHGSLELVKKSLKHQSERRKVDIETDYRNNYAEPLEELRRLDDKLTRDPIDKITMGLAWIHLGYLQLFLFSDLGIIDRAHKIELKLKYMDEDIDDSNYTIYLSNLYSQILGGSFSSTSDKHPRIAEMEKQLEAMLQRRDDMRTLRAVRPPFNVFTSLSESTSVFRNSVGSYGHIKTQTCRLIPIVEALSSGASRDSVKLANTEIQQLQLWRKNLESFWSQLESKFLSGYPDLVLPLTSALALISHGVGALIEQTRQLMFNVELPEERQLIVANIIRFPSLCGSQEDSLRVVDLCSGRETRELIVASLQAPQALREQFRMVKCGLRELYNYLALKGRLSASLWLQFDQLLKQVVLIWHQEKNERERLETEEKSLYRHKAQLHCANLTDEEEILMDLRELFPTYRDVDFGDIDNQATLERQPEPCVVAEESYRGILTDEDVLEIQRLHLQVVRDFTISPWLARRASSVKTNYLDPLIERYYTFAQLLPQLPRCLPGDFGVGIYPSLSVLCSATAKASETGLVGGRVGERAYDFYKDPNVEEVKQCLPVLESTLARIDELLEEWPEHPTLQSIRMIVERLNGFPTTSPVSRFLTGFELLLVKMHEWEENAHSGVSLTVQSTAITQQIIAWRKLELTCWKDCLTAAQRRLQERTSKWWFHLYSLLCCDVDVVEDKPFVADELVASLQQFVLSSSLVEFQPRLDLLLTFHCHVYHSPSSEHRNDVLSILWNTYNYYGQFKGDVDEKIATHRTVVEKKLKDFVKIARWNDINYWSIKETVEKTHRKLVKFIKEFEGGLRENVAPYLHVTPSALSASKTNLPNVAGRPLDVSHFILPLPPTTTRAITTTMDESPVSMENSQLLARVDSLTSKARKICRQAVETSTYPGLRGDIEEFLQERMDHAAELRNATIDATLPKAKQKSLAKSALQQKKLALSNYFKSLSSLGLSYRTGLFNLKNRETSVTSLHNRPVNLTVFTKHVNKTNKLDETISIAWESCETHYYKSLIKLDSLNSGKTIPHKDLGGQNLERCRGFSTHLMLMAHGQKQVIGDSFDALLALRIKAALLEVGNDDEEARGSRLSQRDLRDFAGRLDEVFAVARMSLEQLRIYLDSCPEPADLHDNCETFAIESTFTDNFIAPLKKRDDKWEAADGILRTSLQTLESLAKRYNDLFYDLDEMFKLNDRVQHICPLTHVHLRFLSESYDYLEKMTGSLNEFAEIFGGFEREDPLLESVEYLRETIKSNLEQFRAILLQVERQSNLVNADAVSQFALKLETLISSLLIAMQERYKKCKEAAEEKCERDQEGFVQSQLRDKLIQSLSTEITEMKLQVVSKQFNDILIDIDAMDSTTAASCSRYCIKFIFVLSLLFLND